MFESQLLQVQDKLSQVFVDKFEQLQCGVDALNERISLVEREFALERDKQSREAEEKNAALSNDLTTLQVSSTLVAVSFASIHLHAVDVFWGFIQSPCLLCLCSGVYLLQHAFESDKSSRQERELQLAKRLGDLEYRTEGKFEAEKVQSAIPQGLFLAWLAS